MVIAVIILLIFTDSLFGRSFKDTIQEDLRPNTITFINGLDLATKDESYQLVGEADVNQSLFWNESQSTTQVMVNPRIQLRMVNTNSNPVRTPGFLPRITWFQSFTDTHDWFSSIMLSHHSNGQEDNFYDPETGAVNTKSGDFSTNFVEASIHTNWLTGVRSSVRVYLRQHATGLNRQQELNGQYESTAVGAEYRKTFNTTPSIRSKLYASFNYIVAGKDYVVAPEPRWDIVGTKARPIDKRNVSLKAYIHPTCLDDFSLFIRLDRGKDFYNMRFREEMYKIQIGLAGQAEHLFL